MDIISEVLLNRLAHTKPIVWQFIAKAVQTK